MHWLQIFSSVLILCLSILVPGHSQLLIHEPFDYADLNPLDWAAGGTGWTNDWTRGTGDDIIVRGGNLPYLNLNETDGNFLAAHYEVVGLRYNRAITPIADNGQTVWISFVMRVDPGSNPNSVANITLTKGSNQVLSIGQKFGNQKFGLVWPNAPNYNSNVIVEGLHWVVVKLQFSGTNQTEQAWQWIDPDPDAGIPQEDNADLAVPQAGMTDLKINFGFDGIQVKVEGNGPVYADFDELRLGATFADVNPFSMVDTEEPTNVEPLLIFPNPGSRQFQLQLPDAAPARVQVINQSGQLVWEGQVDHSTSTIQLPRELPQGIYMVTVRGKGFQRSAKLVVQ